MKTISRPQAITRHPKQPQNRSNTNNPFQMKKNLVMAFAAALLLGGLNAQAQAPTPTTATTTAAGPLKLGYTNIDYVLAQTPEAKDIQNQLTIQRTQSENELKRMTKEL